MDHHDTCTICDRPCYDLNTRTPLCQSCNEDFLSFEEDNPELFEGENAEWLDKVKDNFFVLE